MIRIENLTKTYPGRGRSEPVVAIEDLSLDVADNEFVTVLGPSGCGKTTLLRHIAGLVSWDSGTLTVDGVPVTGPAPERSMVFQDFALLPWSTVLSNVGFGLEIRGEPKKVVEERSREVLELVGLGEFADRYPGELSGGMQQRVGLARALAVEPDVLLMDEPFGALDEQTRRLLQEELLRIWERTRMTVVFITHSMEEAVLLGDRVVLMSPRPGRIDEVVEVPMARPRAADVSDLESSAEFRKVVGHLWNRLREML